MAGQTADDGGYRTMNLHPASKLIRFPHASWSVRHPLSHQIGGYIGVSGALIATAPRKAYFKPSRTSRDEEIFWNLSRGHGGVIPVAAHVAN